MKFVYYFVWSIVQFGSESWTLKKDIEKPIQLYTRCSVCSVWQRVLDSQERYRETYTAVHEMFSLFSSAASPGLSRKISRNLYSCTRDVQFVQFGSESWTLKKDIEKPIQLYTRCSVCSVRQRVLDSQERYRETYTAVHEMFSLFSSAASPGLSRKISRNLYSCTRDVQFVQFGSESWTLKKDIEKPIQLYTRCSVCSVRQRVLDSQERYRETYTAVHEMFSLFSSAASPGLSRKISRNLYSCTRDVQFVQLAASPGLSRKISRNLYSCTRDVQFVQFGSESWTLKKDIEKPIQLYTRCSVCSYRLFSLAASPGLSRKISRNLYSCTRDVQFVQFGSESWTLKKDIEKPIQLYTRCSVCSVRQRVLDSQERYRETYTAVHEMWVWRRMHRISWSQRKTGSVIK